MEEQVKYFIPSIEDIRIGYECERYLYNEWKQCVLSEIDNIDGILYAYSVNSKGNIRVPYLTQESIEAENWILKFKSIDLWFEKEVLVENVDWGGLCNLYGYKPYKLFLNYGLHDNKLIIKCDFSGGENFSGSDTLFEGECKSINELRYIQKLLKIK